MLEKWKILDPDPGLNKSQNVVGVRCPKAYPTKNFMNIHPQLFSNPENALYLHDGNVKN